MTGCAFVLLLLVSTQAFAQSAPQPPLTARATQHPSQAGASPPVVIPFEFLVNRPLVRATINGEGPFAFLLAPDTEPSVIDPALVETLDLKVADGTAAVSLEVGFGPSYTLDVPFAIDEVERRRPDLPPALRPHGVLSLSTWKDRLVTLDYTRWRLSIETGALAEPDDQTIFGVADGALWLSLASGAETVRCLVDPWYPGGLIVPAAAFTTLATVSEPRDAGTARTPHGVLRVREARLAHDLLLGPFAVKSPTVLLTDDAASALAGTSWLSRYQVTYDLAHGRVRLERGGPSSRGQQ
jgi:hypothetical protein